MKVSCSLQYGSPTGSLDRGNFLCLLQMNLFYQKFFFVAWWLLLILMAMSIYGLLFRLVQFFSVSFAQYWLSKNVPISFENILKSFSASDCFVLILLFENLNPVCFMNFCNYYLRRRNKKWKDELMVVVVTCWILWIINRLL